MPFVLLMLLVLPFLVEDPVLSHRFMALFLGATGLWGGLRLVAWLAGAPLFDRRTDRARELAAFARALPDQGEQPGGVTRVGRATLVAGSWRGRPFRLGLDPARGLSLELIVSGSPLALRVTRARWLGPWGEAKAERGGNLAGWARPAAGRGEALAGALVAHFGLTRLELQGDLLRVEGPLRRGALEPARLLRLLQDLAAVAELLAPRGDPPSGRGRALGAGTVRHAARG